MADRRVAVAVSCADLDGTRENYFPNAPLMLRLVARAIGGAQNILPNAHRASPDAHAGMTGYNRTPPNAHASLLNAHAAPDDIIRDLPGNFAKCSRSLYTATGFCYFRCEFVFPINFYN